MQLLIVATVSRFTSPWPLWQQRSRDEGRQLTGAPGWCCHQVHLLNLTQRPGEGRERRGERGRGGRRRELKEKDAPERVSRGRRRGVAKKYKEKGLKAKKERGRAAERESVSVYAVCVIAYTLKLYARPSCKEIHRMSLKLRGWRNRCLSVWHWHSGGLTSLPSRSGDGETVRER